MTVVVCCPLCDAESEVVGVPGWAATVMVECPRCGHVFDIAPPPDEPDSSCD